MDDLRKKSHLGRGLSSLIPVSETAGEFVRNINISDIISNKFQPRDHFIEEKLKGLEESIRENGVIQPIIVRKNGDKYEIVAGERRFIASKRLGVNEIPAIIKNVTDRKSLEIALVENIQRDDLNPIEEAKGYLMLCDEFNLSQDNVAKTVGKSRTAITNSMRLLKLPEKIQKAIIDGVISVGHAKVLLSLDNTDDQFFAFEKILKRNLNVRQLEELIKHMKAPAKEPILNPLSVELKEKYINSAKLIKEFIGRDIEIKALGDKGKIIINFDSKEDFENILNKFKRRS